jgi:uncharacterized protein YcgI (DUF1989 family)
MAREFVVNAQSAIAFRLMKGGSLRIIDVEGKQVADFWAVHDRDPNEFLSPGVTIDCNESVRVEQGGYLFTNHYNPMFFIEADDVGQHDLLHPCCRPEMYDYFYGNGNNHPNCFENILAAIRTINAVDLPILRPFNMFMNTEIRADGKISVGEPLSKPGDSICLRAMSDAIVAVAACSVSESACNGGHCTPLRVVLNG